MTTLKPRLLRLFALVRRYPGVIAAFGFVSGLVSFFMVDRHEGFARIVAMLMLVSWVWLILEQVLHRAVERWFRLSLPPPVLRYATQLIHQESLFFSLPFFATTTSWNSGQLVFTGLLGVAALVSIIDPIYYRWLAPRRWLYLTYHTLTLFAVLLAALPVILQIPTPESYKLALGVAVLLSFPSVAGSLPLQRWWRGLVLLALMAALAGVGWWLRLWVPPATLWLHHVAVTTQVDDANRAPGKSLRELSPAELRGQGLYAYTAINAPLGLQERIWHIWMHDGVEVDRIAIDIRGGRKEGYRAWTHKQNFPDRPVGRWQVKVLTDAGQMIGMLRFRVIEAAAPDGAATLQH